MKPEHLDLLVGCASNGHFRKSEIIFRAGEQADWFYLIRHGSVTLEMPGPGESPITVLALSEKEVLGWSWLVPPYKWKFDARAAEPTRAIRLNGKCLREKWERDHDLGFELLQRFARIGGHRLEATRFALISVCGAHPPEPLVN
jgi:CRP-like cAMP-binding protein